MVASRPERGGVPPEASGVRNRRPVTSPRSTDPQHRAVSNRGSPTAAGRFRVLAVNPGASSTKIGLFQDETAVLVETIPHDDEELATYAGRPILDQLPMRLTAIRATLDRAVQDAAALDAVAGRGGLLGPVPSGTFRVNEVMLEELGRAPRGEHASNLGAVLAHHVAATAGCPAFIVDPVSVDEWPAVARFSGMAGLDRVCLSHALNTKAVARRFARERGRDYRQLRLIVAHLGSGVSVSAHRDGRMVDVCNSREEGPFAMDRAGGLPVMQLLQLAFSSTVDRGQLERRVFGEGGVFSYLSTRDLREAYRRADDGDSQAAAVLDAMVYQIAREVGAMAAVLQGGVDAILLTGGMAHSERLVQALSRGIAWIAPVHLYPGEDELRALAEGALRVLRGEERAREYDGGD